MALYCVAKSGSYVQQACISFRAQATVFGAPRAATGGGNARPKVGGGQGCAVVLANDSGVMLFVLSLDVFNCNGSSAFPSPSQMVRAHHCTRKIVCTRMIGRVAFLELMVNVGNSKFANCFIL